MTTTSFDQGRFGHHKSPLEQIVNQKTATTTYSHVSVSSTSAVGSLIVLLINRITALSYSLSLLQRSFIRLTG